jgi:hypothetical protein
MIEVDKDFVLRNNYAGIEVTSGSASAPTYRFKTYTNHGMYSIGQNILGFSTDSTERMRIDSSGNIGIGLTSPSSLLHISGSGGESKGIIVKDINI